MTTVISLRLLVVLLGFGLLLLLAFAWLLRRLSVLEHQLAHRPQPRKEKEEEPLKPHMDLALDAPLSGVAFSRVGLVHYDAFDPGEDHKSFSLCLLNDYNDGFILTSLSYDGRTRSYAKKVVQGRIEGPSSDEEVRALADARGLLQERETHEPL